MNYDLKNKIRLESDIANEIKDFLSSINSLDSGLIAKEYLSDKRASEQLDVLRRYEKELNGKKILEIGSGYGMFVAHGNAVCGLDIVGIEPAKDEYSFAYNASKRLLKIYGLSEDRIKNSSGDNLPFDDCSYDVVYSSNVLEHVKNPGAVLGESIRVLKKGGLLQFVVPSYGSYWEGHYCVFWIPYMSRFFARIYLRIIGKKTEFLESLSLVDAFKVKKWVKDQLQSGEIEIISMGEDVFIERMNKLDFTAWAGLSKIVPILNFLKKMKIIRFATWFMLKTNTFSPLVITIRKK